VVQNGYALIIQNEKYKTAELGSTISNVIVSYFFEKFGFKSELSSNLSAQVT